MTEPVAQLIEGYLTPYRCRTLENYTGYLRRWTTWCGTRIDPARPTRTDIEAWIGELREEGLGDNTIRSYLSAVAGLTRWLVTEGHLDTDPMTHVRRPATPRAGARSWLSRPERAAFIAAVQDDPDLNVRAAHASTAQMPAYDHLRSVAGGDIAIRLYDAIAA
ncbi:Phage integrase, N-terminal SAM-like domain [Promicromonospora umidemergens]|uniref:Core-binding (CB) domain-containing protein n=2 Tax=Promicromonospora TaxID=43676 RepID=A0ABP8XHA0_9MICO|nr:site-specific integrase [Promicromonospora umidemergens]MCP2284977.1 Phage integrase, N-terminal SAM-like domain [Promicromonospora umidemergens]